MPIVSLGVPPVNPILEPGAVWSDKTGKIYDVKEETC